MLKYDRKLIYLSAAFLFILTGAVDSFAQEIRERSRGYDFDEPPETKYEIAPYLTFGAQIDFEFVYERNLDLDNENDEDLITLEPAIETAFSFDPAEFFQVFTSIKWGGEFMFEDGMTIQDDGIIRVEEAYVFFKNLFEDRFSLQIGRQQFEDERKWIYDAELDGVRAFIGQGGFLAQLSVSRGGLVDLELLNKEVDENINNYVAYLSYYFTEDTDIGGYVFYRDDTTSEDDSPIYIGLHSIVEATEDLELWLEFAYITGEDGPENINGAALDVGGIYVLYETLEPSISLGYALGSSEFRQTDLQGNEADLNGVVDFSFYGELLDPNLANLSIIYGGPGINPTEETSINLVYHYYSQVKASDEFFDVNLDAEPDGINKSIGSEIDLILGYEQESENLVMELTFGYFIPGGAFPSDAENAFYTSVVFQYEF